MHFQTVLQQARTEPYHHYYQLHRSFVSVHTHTVVGVGGCRHARSSLANTGRLAAGISDRYSAKSAGRRGEHTAIRISTVGPSQDPDYGLSLYALGYAPPF